MEKQGLVMAEGYEKIHAADIVVRSEVIREWSRYDCKLPKAEIVLDTLYG